MDKISKAKTLFHAMIEKDAQELQYGTSAYTIFINNNGEPVLSSLKVTKSKRKKYVQK